MAPHTDAGGSGEKKKMGVITTLVLAGAALLLGWAAVEVACKPCLQSGREAINRSLDPDYDPDDNLSGSYSEAPRKEEEEEEVKKLPKEV